MNLEQPAYRHVYSYVNIIIYVYLSIVYKYLFSLDLDIDVYPGVMCMYIHNIDTQC